MNGPVKVGYRTFLLFVILIFCPKSTFLVPEAFVKGPPLAGGHFHATLRISRVGVSQRFTRLFSDDRILKTSLSLSPLAPLHLSRLL